MSTCVMVVGWKCDQDGNVTADITCGKPAGYLVEHTVPACEDCAKAIADHDDGIPVAKMEDCS